MDITRISTGTDGQSHFEDLVVDLNDLGPMGLISDTIPASGVQFRKVSGDYHATSTEHPSASTSST